MFNRVPRVVTYLAAMLLLFAGVTCIVLAILWRIQQRTELPAATIEAIGVALIGAAVAAVTVDEILRCRIVNEVVKQVEKRLESIYATLLAVRDSSIKSVYATRAEARSPMVRAIQQADRFIYVMGISLHRFFHEGTDEKPKAEENLCRALLSAFNSGKEVRALILDNRSEAAHARSEREEPVEAAPQDGQSRRRYELRTLFTDTLGSILYADEHYAWEARAGKSGMRAYNQQSLFLLITDKVAFMEPYHWGDRRPGEGLERLAERVPVLEFEKTSIRGPYEQFLGHFDYVYGKSQEPSPANRDPAISG